MSRQTEEAKKLARHLLDRYFRTIPDYLSRHHIQSYEQFIQADLPRIIRANNPFILYKSQIDPEKKRKTGEKPTYEYKVEIYIGGVDGTALKIGTPTVALQNGKEIRALFPNEARLRNLTYQSQITADITVRITYNPNGPSNREISEDQLVQTIQIPDWNLFQMPILLHSKYCLLGGQSADFLREAGECMYDQGGYFILGGVERVLIPQMHLKYNCIQVIQQSDTVTFEPKIWTTAPFSSESARFASRTRPRTVALSRT
jgi:DNA-directed RNA polymerase II subunit RPB2